MSNYDNYKVTITGKFSQSTLKVKLKKYPTDPTNWYFIKILSIIYLFLDHLMKSNHHYYNKILKNLKLQANSDSVTQEDLLAVVFFFLLN